MLGHSSKIIHELSLFEAMDSLGWTANVRNRLREMLQRFTKAFKDFLICQV